MDDTQRAALLLEQDKTKDAVTALTSKLKEAGQAWQFLANLLANNPSSAVFQNVPSEVGSYKFRIGGGADWNKLATKEDLVKWTFDLHTQEDKLKTLERQLLKK